MCEKERRKEQKRTRAQDDVESLCVMHVNMRYEQRKDGRTYQPMMIVRERKEVPLLQQSRQLKPVMKTLWVDAAIARDTTQGQRKRETAT
jgi:hypothetical protein